MVGVPVIINHKDINKDNADDLRVGVVNSVWYDNKDGWYWCDGIIWDETAQNLITDKNWSVSCSYDVKTANDEGGSENNIKYDMEFLDGVFTHLALVNNPRYERANIVFNSKTEILNDKWITIKPNGEDSKGKHLLLKDGETPKEAIERVYKKEDKQTETYKKITDEYKEYFNEEQLKEFNKELTRFDKYKGLENVDWKTSKEQFLKMKPEDALRTLKDTNDLQERWDKEDKLKAKFDNYIKKLDIKDSRLSELRRFIGSFEKYFTDKIPSFDEFRDDPRYNFSTDLALKYLADDKGFEHFDNISDRERAKVKSGYDKFLKILGVNNTKQNEEMNVENDKWVTKYDKEGEPYHVNIDDTDDKEEKKSDTKDKQSNSKGDLDIKKTTVKMKSGKEKEIEYVDSVPEGYKKLEGAMTAPLGYTWYHNGKSIIDKERKTILVKDKVNNSKETEMALIEELKKLITKVENTKGEKDMEIENEKVDKRDIIRQIMAIAGKEEASEDVKTIAKLAEKLAYDKSEAGTADNKCKNKEEKDEKEVEEVKEEIKEDVDNKCKNSVDNSKEDYFAKLNEIYNAASQAQEETSEYISRADREKAAEDYFAK